MTTKPRPVHLLGKDPRWTHCGRTLVDGGTTETTLLSWRVTCKQCLNRRLP